MSPRIRHNLLPLGRHFVGREAEVDDLAARVEAARLVHLTGPAGIGKTDLTRAVGHRLLEARTFPGGVFHLTLEGATRVTSLSGDLVFHAGVYDTRAPGGPRRLVIWDQMDGPLAHAAETVRRYFADVTRSDAWHHLVVHRSAPLEAEAGVVEENVQLGPLSPDAALAAFTAHLPDTVSATPAPDDRALLDTLERMGGNPLAIRLAARWCRPPRWTNVLPEGLEETGAGAPDGVEGPLAAALALALADMDEPARRLMGLLAALPAGAGEAMLLTVFGEEWDGPAGLLERTGVVEALGERHILHPAVRQVAPAILGARQAQTLWSQVAYYLHQTLVDYKRLAAEGDQGAGARFVIREWENLRATFNWAMDRVAEGGMDLEEDARLAIDCALAAFHLTYTRGMFREGLAWMEAVLPVAERFAEVYDRAGILDYLGLFQTRLGQRAEAHGSFEAAMAAYREAGHESGEGAASYHLGLSHAARGETEAARAAFEVALDRLRGGTGRVYAPQAATHLGLIQLDAGEPEAAYETLTDAAALYEEYDNDPFLRVRAEIGLAEAAIRTGRAPESTQHAHRAMELAFKAHPRGITGTVPDMLRLVRVYVDADAPEALGAYVWDVVAKIEALRGGTPRKSVERDWALAVQALDRVAKLLALMGAAFGPEREDPSIAEQARGALPDAARALDKMTGGRFGAEQWVAGRLGAG